MVHPGLRAGSRTVLGLLGASVAALAVYQCGSSTPAAPPTGTGGAGGAGGPQQPCPASGVLYGPWALRFGPDSAVVRWDACAPGSADITLTDEDGGAPRTVSGSQTAALVQTRYDAITSVPPDLPGTRYTTEVTIEGLAPGHCYGYVLAADAARKGRLCTAKPAGAPFTWLAIGDTNAAIGDTAGVLANTLTEKPDFAIHLGDIQLYSSVFESYATWFPAMTPLFQAGAFEPCVGNHEIEIEHEYEDYYVRLFGGAGFDSKVPEYYRFESGGVWFFSLSTEQDFGEGTEQGKWLEASLADAAARPGYRFSVVFFHKPMITLANYSQRKTERQYYAPLFLEKGVKLVMSGHVHGYERFVDGALTYVIAGGGGAALHDLNEKKDERPEEAALRVAAHKRYHAVVLKVGAEALEARVIASDGEELDAFSIPIAAE